MMVGQVDHRIGEVKQDSSNWDTAEIYLSAIGSDFFPGGLRVFQCSTKLQEDLLEDFLYTLVR